MIFLLSAAALGIGGMVGFLAHEKGRSPFGWALYGALLAPLALPHILLAPRRPEPIEPPEPIGPMTQMLQESQSVNSRRTTFKFDRPTRAEPSTLAKATLDPLHAERNELPNAEPLSERNAPRAEPTLERHGANDDANKSGRVGAARHAEFVVTPGERIGAPQTRGGDANLRPGEDRIRAPLSIDPGERAPSQGGSLRRVVGAAVLLIAGGVSAFLLHDYLPAGWRWNGSNSTREVPPAGLTPPPGVTADAQPTVTQDTAPQPADGTPATSDPAAKEVGTAQLAKPIPSRQETKSVPRDPSPAKEANLALATRGMQPADPAKTDPAKTESTKAEPAKPEPPKAADPAPAPAKQPAAAPKAAPKSDAKSIASPSKPAPKPAPKPAAQATPEDFLAMVNRALGASNGASSADGDDATATGEMVETIQVKLRERGFDPGGIDGRAGAKTTQAIRDFQQSIGMAPNGRIDMALMEKLGIVGKRLQFPSR